MLCELILKQLTKEELIKVLQEMQGIIQEKDEELRKANGRLSLQKSYSDVLMGNHKGLQESQDDLLHLLRKCQISIIANLEYIPENLQNTDGFLTIYQTNTDRESLLETLRKINEVLDAG